MKPKNVKLLAFGLVGLLTLPVILVFACIGFFLVMIAVPIDFPPPPVVIPQFAWRDIEEYSPYSCSTSGLCHILPYEDLSKPEQAYDFIEQFDYIEAKYAHYCQDAFFKDWRCRSIMPFTYSAEVYEEAKQYAMDNFVLSKEHCFSYNGYVFVENITHASTTHDGLDENGENKEFPRWFNMFAYNDEKKTLVFLGFYYSDEVTTLTNENIGDFLKEYYYIYDFDT